ncbi:MAG: hypothetical protein AAB354_02760 [candidate division KSB1 bacterium]
MLTYHRVPKHFVCGANICCLVKVAFLSALIALPLFAQENSSGVALERATSAKELAQHAVERAEASQTIAQRAEAAAQEAMVASKNALELSDRRFEAIQFLLYIMTGITGAFVVITSVFETVRRRTEQSRFEQLLRRQDKIDTVQFDLGQKVLGKFDESFQSQIDSISKLGSVVDLVSKTFEIQNRASAEQIALIKKVEELTNIVTKQREAYLHQFDKVHEDLMSFNNLSRMAWTKIGLEEQNLITRAQLKFETIDEFVLSDVPQHERVPHVCYLLGISTFYRNDIITSLDYFRRAIKLYDELGDNEERKTSQHHYPYAFSHHYLGVIEKSWWDKAIPLDLNKQKAKQYLERASEMLGGKEGEILTPLTLAEVLSYIPGERALARDHIMRCVADIGKREGGGGLDLNQYALLSRAHLLLGNLDYFEACWEAALDNYALSTQKVENYFYGYFSQAQVAQKLGRPEAIAVYREGLRALQASAALDKPELTTRGTLLAWSAIAAHSTNDPRKNEYLSLFKTFIHQVRQVGNRIPLFFCPITKLPVTHQELHDNVLNEVRA